MCGTRGWRRRLTNVPGLPASQSAPTPRGGSTERVHSLISGGQPGAAAATPSTAPMPRPTPVDKTNKSRFRCLQHRSWTHTVSLKTGRGFRDILEEGVDMASASTVGAMRSAAEVAGGRTGVAGRSALRSQSPVRLDP